MPYLQGLEEKISNISNELLRFHASEYIDFIHGLTELSNIMDKKFYLVVGYEPTTVSSSGLLGNILGRKEQSKISFSINEWKKYTEEIGQRVGLIISGLSAMGMASQQLDTQKTIELFYNVYNPQEAIAEKLTDIENMRASVVSGKSNNATPPNPPSPTGPAEQSLEEKVNSITPPDMEALKKESQIQAIKPEPNPAAANLANPNPDTSTNNQPISPATPPVDRTNI